MAWPPPGIYEECPDCDGLGREPDAEWDCIWCEGTGLVPHECDEVLA